MRPANQTHAPERRCTAAIFLNAEYPPSLGKPLRISGGFADLAFRLAIKKPLRIPGGFADLVFRLAVKKPLRIPEGFGFIGHYFR